VAASVSLVGAPTSYIRLLPKDAEVFAIRESTSHIAVLTIEEVDMFLMYIFRHRVDVPPKPYIESPFEMRSPHLKLLSPTVTVSVVPSNDM
jgi:hypothetical protein